MEKFHLFNTGCGKKNSLIKETNKNQTKYQKNKLYL